MNSNVNFLWLSVQCAIKRLRYAMVAALLLCSSFSYGHAYMDFAITDMWLDSECHLNVKVVNEGGSLPDHFYYAKSPALLNITKGEQQETSASFTQLDTERVLAKDKSALMIKSSMVFANNAKPVTAAIRYGSEFGDFNQRNDSLTRAMDCQLGIGQMAGEAITFNAPDVAISHTSIDETTCELNLQLVNKTGIALKSEAWAKNNGVEVIFKNTETGKRFKATPLLQLDPQQQFTQQNQHLQWRSALTAMPMQHMTVAIWYVTGDLDFSNNEQTLDIPTNCRHKNNK